MGLLFRFRLAKEPTGGRPLQTAEATVVIEELQALTYSIFGYSQYVAVQDNCSEIAGQAVSHGLCGRPSPREPFRAINLLRTRTIQVINCRARYAKIVRDILRNSRNARSPDIACEACGDFAGGLRQRRQSEYRTDARTKRSRKTTFWRPS